MMFASYIPHTQHNLSLSPSLSLCRSMTGSSSPPPSDTDPFFVRDHLGLYSQAHVMPGTLPCLCPPQLHSCGTRSQLLHSGDVIEYPLSLSPGPQHLYPPDTSALSYRPSLGLAGRHSGHPSPPYQISSSTSSSPGGASLPQLPHQYPQPTHFSYTPSTQSSYSPSPAFQTRQNIPYSVLQPLQTYIPGLPAQTVGYVSPTTSTLGAHPGGAGSAYSSLPPPSGGSPGQGSATGGFPSSETFTPASQGAQAPGDQQQSTTTPPQGWNPPNYP